MRTVILFGLLSIADSIGEQTGWHLSGVSVSFGGVVLICAILFDIVDVIYLVSRRNT